MNKWQTFSLKSLLVITALAAVFVAWRVYRYEHQTIDVWIDAVLAQEKAHPLDYDSDISFDQREHWSTQCTPNTASRRTRKNGAGGA